MTQSMQLIAENRTKCCRAKSVPKAPCLVRNCFFQTGEPSYLGSSCNTPCLLKPYSWTTTITLFYRIQDET